MPTPKQIDTARAMGALVTEMLTEHAALLDDVSISIGAWPGLTDSMSREQAIGYIEAFAERYKLTIHDDSAGRRATLTNRAFGDSAAISLTLFGPITRES